MQLYPLILVIVAVTVYTVTGAPQVAPTSSDVPTGSGTLSNPLSSPQNAFSAPASSLMSFGGLGTQGRKPTVDDSDEEEEEEEEEESESDEDSKKKKKKGKKGKGKDKKKGKKGKKDEDDDNAMKKMGRSFGMS